MADSNIFMRLRSFIAHGLAQLFNLTIMDRNGGNATIHVRSGAVTVKGFMRDYRLLSKIPSSLWVGGSSRDDEDEDEDAITDNYDSVLNMPTARFNGVGVSAARIEDPDNPGTLIPNPNISFNARNNRRVTRPADKLHQSPDVTDTIQLSPKQVYCELKTVPTPFTLENLDAKVSTYTKMLDLVRIDSSGGNKETIKDVLQRLKNRQKYASSKDVRAFFDGFKNTSDEMVTELLKAHRHLKIGPADDFIPEFPTDAHETMIAYSEKVVSMCDQKPVFYIIAKAKDFKTKTGVREKRDPILLVQSPFGLYWQILGAWDEEMILVNDL